MADYHRKIELQNPDDLQYLIANVRRAANEKINQALPPMEGEDTMRPLVEEMVHDYITSVFQSASENLTINGLPPPSTILSQTSNHTAAPLQIEEHEPLDNKLSAKAVALLQQEEQLLEEIAALRRKMPGVAVEKAKEGYRKAGEADEEALRIMQEVIREDVEESRKVGLGVGLLERQQGMETNWGRGIAGLEGLKSGLPETVAKKERAERAENYVISPEKKG